MTRLINLTPYKSKLISDGYQGYLQNDSTLPSKLISERYQGYLQCDTPVKTDFR